MLEAIAVSGNWTKIFPPLSEWVLHPLEPSSPSPLKRITSQIILNFAALSNNLSIDGVKPYSFAHASSKPNQITRQNVVLYKYGVFNDLPHSRRTVRKNIAYKKGVFPFSANARGKTTGEAIGNIKVISHQKTDRVLAVHIVGAHAGELVGQAVTAIEAGFSAEDIALTCHAHPTLSESMKEAASLASIGKTLHFWFTII